MATDIEQAASELRAATLNAARASQQMHDFANLGATATITTDNGPIPSIAKYLADKNAQITAGLNTFHEAITGSVAAKDDASKGAGQVGYGPAQSYELGTVGGTLKAISRTQDVSLIALGLSGFVDRGAWQGTTAYAVGDMYTVDGQINYVAVAHTSTTVSADFTAGKVFRKNADFVSYVDPIGYAKPAQTWADMATGLIKRLNAAGNAWVIIGSLFQRAASIYPSDAIPTTNIGPIYVEPFGWMTFDQAAGLYISRECGLSGGFYMATPPPGWIKANGAIVSRTDPMYRGIFARIGTIYGVGNGTTTFQLPDGRGEFERGLDDGRAIDAGRAIGSAQSQTLQSHTHAVTDPTHAHSVSDPTHTHAVYDPSHAHPYNSISTVDGQGSAVGTSNQHYGTTTGYSVTGISLYAAATGIGIYAAATGVSIQNTGSPETRPRNIAVLKCIHI